MRVGLASEERGVCKHDRKTMCMRGCMCSGCNSVDGRLCTVSVADKEGSGGTRQGWPMVCARVFGKMGSNNGDVSA